MSKRCPECRYVNDDARLFCASCGTALDAQVRLIQNLERQRDSIAKQEPDPRRRDMKFYTSSAPAPKKKKKRSPLPWLLLGLAAAAAVWLLLVK